MEQYDHRFDMYIEKAQPFARPVLVYLRELVHQVSPLFTETIKWGLPFFEHNGNVCYMAAFKKHCAFGFWKAALLNDPDHILRRDDAKAGNLGPVLTIDDLPSKEVLINFIQQAISLNENDVKLPAKKAPAKQKAPVVVPDYFIGFLEEYPKAKEAFNKFSQSHQREYLEWIIDAKSEATRLKRMETAAEWMAEGKSRNWKYK